MRSQKKVCDLGWRRRGRLVRRVFGFGAGGLECRVFTTAKMAHLIDDETVAKIGQPVVVVWSDVGHPPTEEEGISTIQPGLVMRSFDTT